MAPGTLWLFGITVFFVSATPGPNMLHIMARSAELGLARVTVAMAGCFAGLAVLFFASVAGVSALLLAAPGALTALCLAGAAYLVWLGWLAWRDGSAPEPVPGAVRMPAGARAASASPAQVFGRAFAVSVSNPKAVVFLSALLPQFIDPARPRLPQFATMLAVIGVIETLWYLVYALGGRTLSGWLAGARSRRLFARVTGVLFAGFGLAMAGFRLG